MTVKSKRSIRRRLSGIIMLTSTTAVLLACLGFVIADLVSLRKGLAADLSAFAEIVSVNVIEELTFGDPQGLLEDLSPLKTRPSIVAAGIYTDKGELFGKYEPNASVSVPRAVPKDGFHDRGDLLELVRGIQHDHHRIGTIYIVSDSRDRNARLTHDVEIAAVIVFVSLLLAFFLSSILQRDISQPIVELAQVTRLVSDHKNYTVRTRPRHLSDGDEIDDLMIGFNSMLTEIEQRDKRLLVARNIAERAAEANAQLARESALILNNSSDGIMGVDLNSEPTFINPAAERMLGRKLSELRGASMHQLIHHTRADGSPWPEGDCELGVAIIRGEPFQVTADTFWRADGTSFPVEYSVAPMFDDDGRRHGAVFTFRDVTERQAIDRLKSEFVSTVSHELRTPLTSIRGALGLLSSGLLGTVADKGQRMLEIAVSNTDRLVRLINDILDLERIGSGKTEITRGSVDARAVMGQALEGVLSMADQAGIHLAIEPASADLLGDADRIVQTLTNLLGNAIKFSPAGTTVTVSGAPNGAYFAFCVSDQGRGIPEEKRGTIFERFSQVDASDSRDKGGSGLGLAICQSIVEAHGGRIWVEPNHPAGSRFQFTIPLASPAIDAPAPESTDSLMSPDGPLPAGLPLALVLEDDLDLARVIAASLESRGIRTIRAISGADALPLCELHQPELIVLEVLLPNMDGYEIVRALRQNPTLARTPLVVYSAVEIGSADQARLRLGPTEFLTKSKCGPSSLSDHAIQLLEASMKEKESQHAA
jgi:PAS domain S-box-containing protein